MQKWTNQAINPSNSRDRGYYDTQAILSDIGVAECARPYLASQIVTKMGYTPAMVSNSGVWTKNATYQPNMVMSFGDHESAEVVPDVDSPFVAEVYSHQCNGGVYDVAYMPKCQNLGHLKPMVPVVPDYPSITGNDKPHGTVDSPSTLALLMVGLALAYLKTK